MSERQHNLMVGVFVLVAIGALGVLVILFGERPEILGGRTYRVVAFFESVEGINHGMRVSMSGITIGEVERIGWADKDHPESGVNVVLRIFEEYTIPSTARAQVEASAIGFGTPSFIIAFPPGEPARPLSREGDARIPGFMEKATIVPEPTLAVLESAVERVGALAAALKPVALDLHYFLEPRPIDAVDQPPTATAPAERPVPNLSTVTQRLDLTLAHIDEVLGDPEVQSNLRVAVDNIAAASRDLPKITQDMKALAVKMDSKLDEVTPIFASARATVENANHRITEFSEQLMQATGKLGRSLDNVEKVTRAIAAGEGTLGKFIFDPTLYNELTYTASRINEAIRGIVALVNSLRAAQGGA